MPLTKLSLAGKNLIIPGHGEFGKLHPGWGWENCQPFFTMYIMHSEALTHDDLSTLKWLMYLAQ
jgi:hypothetical protein